MKPNDLLRDINDPTWREKEQAHYAKLIDTIPTVKRFLQVPMTTPHTAEALAEQLNPAGTHSLAYCADAAAMLRSQAQEIERQDMLLLAQGMPLIELKHKIDTLRAENVNQAQEIERLTAVIAQMESVEPYGYVIENNIKMGPYKYQFYLPSDIGTAYKDNAIAVTPVYTAAPVQPAVNGWKEAMLDGLAAHAIDAPVDMPPHEVLAMILHMAETIATDTQVSDLAKTCAWTQEDDFDMPGVYRTGCGEVWSFTEGGIKDNGMLYCHHCGGKIIEGNA